MFVEHGLAAAKVEDITARAGVSKGAFYLHFESKEDCFRQIVEGFVAKLAACLDDAPSAVGRRRGRGHSGRAHRPLARPRSRIFEFCWQNRGLMGMLFSGGGGASYAYLIDEFAERVADRSRGWARHLMAVGVYRKDLDPEVLPALISGGYERLVREMIERPGAPTSRAGRARPWRSTCAACSRTTRARFLTARSTVGFVGDERAPLPVVQLAASRAAKASGTDEQQPSGTGDGAAEGHRGRRWRWRRGSASSR